jgi:hypothetical protein
MKTPLEISSRSRLGTVEHTGTFAPDASNALLRINLYFGAQKSCLSKLARRLKEFPCVNARECQDFFTQSMFEEPKEFTKNRNAVN